MKLRLISSLGVTLLFGSAFASETPSAETLLKSWLKNVKAIEALGPYRVTGTSKGRSILDEGAAQTGTWQCVRDGRKLRWDVRFPDQESRSIAFDGNKWQFLTSNKLPGGTEQRGGTVVDPKTDVAREIHFQDFEGLGGPYPLSLKPIAGVTLRRRDSGTLPNEYLADVANLRVTRVAEDSAETYRLTLTKKSNSELASLPETVILRSYGDRFLPVLMTRRYESPDGDPTTVEYRFEDYNQYGSVWLPSREQMRSTARYAAGQTAEISARTLTLKFEGLPSPVPAKTFSLDFPKGTNVFDQRTDSPPSGKELPPIFPPPHETSTNTPWWLLLGIAPLVVMMRKRK